MWDKDTRPGPIAIIAKLPASRIKSNSNPLSPVKLAACFTKKIAPSISIANIVEEILVNTPTINRIPGTNSASAIGICISAGMPMSVKNPTNPGLNLGKP